MAALIADIEVEYASDWVLGVEALISQDPDATPSKPLVRSPIPACHAASAHVRRRFLEAYAVFRDLYKQAAARLRGNAHPAGVEIRQQYPAGALVRPRWYVPAPASLAATWLRGLDDADLALA